MESDNLGISIIIPVYNREKFLKEAIDSILNQKYSGSLEIIISDDGSTDKSLDIARSYNDMRIIILEKPSDCKTQGAAAARNRGILASTQPYICFLDSDDYQLDGFLTKMSQVLSKEKTLDYVFCRTIEQIEEDGDIQKIPWTRSRILQLDLKYLGLTRSHIINTNCFLFKRYIFDKVGLFNENYTNAEDADLWIKIGEVFRGDFVNINGAVRRTHNGEQLSKNQNDKIRECIRAVLNDALIRINKEKRNAFRIYKLKNMLLNNSDLPKNKYIKAKLILMISNPVQSIKHLYLLLS